MADKHRFKFDESKFRPKQREAALALVEYEFTPKGARKTKEEIATDLGITRKTLHNWDTQDDNFINYKNYLSSDFMDSHMAFVYSKLLQSIDKGSVRGIELYMKRIGDLKDQHEVKFEQTTDNQSFDERKAELLKRLGAETKPEGE